MENDETQHDHKTHKCDDDDDDDDDDIDGDEDDDNDDDDDVDGDDDKFYEDALEKEDSPRKQRRPDQPLIPESVSDEAEATQNFITEFHARFGGENPPFFEGSLIDAIFATQFCNQLNDCNILLAVYIHHDKSVQSNVFCSEFLCNDLVKSYMSSNFVTWPWDVTTERNRNWFCSITRDLLDDGTKSVLSTLYLDELPKLCLFFCHERIPRLVFIDTIQRRTNNISQGLMPVQEALNDMISARDIVSGKLESQIDLEFHFLGACHDHVNDFDSSLSLWQIDILDQDLDLNKDVMDHGEPQRPSEDLDNMDLCELENHGADLSKDNMDPHEQDMKDHQTDDVDKSSDDDIHVEPCIQALSAPKLSEECVTSEEKGPPDEK